MSSRAVRPAWRREEAQGAVEFALTIGLLMLLVVATAQLAIVLHYRTTLEVAAQEGAFQASLAGHSISDAAPATRELWSKLEPSGRPVEVTATRQGDLIVVTAHTSAPALLPSPVPPFNAIPITVRSSHTIERFQP